MTEWDEFRKIDFALLKQQMAAPVLVDLRNMFSEECLARRGFKYCGIGNGNPSLRHQAISIEIGARVRSGRRVYQRAEDIEESLAPIAAAE
jgi:hypothetical protein